MSYLNLIPILVIAAPVVFLGVVCLVHTMEASVKGSIGQ
jgi:hypothetical protein